MTFGEEMKVSIEEVISLADKVSEDKYVSLMNRATSWIGGPGMIEKMNPFIRCMYCYVVLRAYSPSIYEVSVDEDGVVCLRSWLYNIRCGEMWTSISEYTETSTSIDSVIANLCAYLRPTTKLSRDDVLTLMSSNPFDVDLTIKNWLDKQGLPSTHDSEYICIVVGGHLIRETIQLIYREIPPGSNPMMRYRDRIFNSDIDIVCLG